MVSVRRCSIERWIDMLTKELMDRGNAQMAPGHRETKAVRARHDTLKPKQSGDLRLQHAARVVGSEGRGGVPLLV